MSKLFEYILISLACPLVLPLVLLIDEPQEREEVWKSDKDGKV